MSCTFGEVNKPLLKRTSTQKDTMLKDSPDRLSGLGGGGCRALLPWAQQTLKERQAEHSGSK